MSTISTKLFSIENIEILKQMVKSYPNDFELGKEIRNKFRNDSFVSVIGMGNDQILGKEIRKNIQNI